jgi:hypothetical protein
LRIEALRAFADDEGSVQETCIRFVSGSRRLLEDFRKLIIDLVKEDRALSLVEKNDLLHAISDVKGQERWFRLSLGVPFFKWFYENVGFTHPEKEKELEFEIRTRKERKKLSKAEKERLILSDSRKVRKQRKKSR